LSERHPRSTELSPSMLLQYTAYPQIRYFPGVTFRGRVTSERLPC